MSKSADSIIAAYKDCGEPSPRSTCSYSSRDSRDQFIRPTPARAIKILQRLLYDRMNDRYEITEVFDKHIRTVINNFCVVSVETQGSLESLVEDNIELFMQAMEDNRDIAIIRNKSHTPSSASDTCNNQDIEKCELRRVMSSDSMLSTTSINSQDSDNTKSVKRVSMWKKYKKKPSSSSYLKPGVMWNKSNISPHSIIEYGLYVIQEHILEEHLTKFEMAIEEHEVELMNEKRAIQGKHAIDHNTCVVINDEVYVTGGPAEFECVMETFDDKVDVLIMVYVHSATSACRENVSKKFMVENEDTGHIVMQYKIDDLRFWNELGTSTISMQVKNTTNQYIVTPNIYFHLKSISHYRVFAKQLF
tara:strand:+ start:571 stop:1653 length:1083 start_codon:yes stop_codon:yes gene_type:complete